MAIKGVQQCNKGHKADAEGVLVRYDIWDNRTDRCLGVGLTGNEAAELMGIKRSTLHCYMRRVKRGELRKWHIERYYVDSVEDEEEEKGGDEEDGVF